MIYVTYKYCPLSEANTIKDIWEVDCEDLEQKFRSYILGKARELNLEINPHWLNVLDFELHNNHLTQEEFKAKCKVWKNRPTLKHFIKNELEGKKVKYLNLLIN